MGFDISAVGTSNFEYKRKGCEDGSTFTFIKVFTMLQSLDVSSMGKAAQNATKEIAKDMLIPSVADVAISIMEKEMLHNLSNAVCFLAMNSNAGGGWIFVEATETNTFFPDTHRSAKYEFSPGDMPGAEFITTIWRSLSDTGLDNFGVLQHLSIALSRFSNHIEDSMKPMINISLTN